MGKTDDLKYIKDHYGEKMMKLCRDLFPTILEIPGELSRIMGECFYPAKYLYYDIVANNLKNQFRNYIYKRFEKEQKELISINKTPFELMEDAGYELYECKTEEEIQAFRKYYDKRGQKYDMCRNEIPRHVGEELCTFDGGRLESCHVFFAVKKEAEKLNREDFKNPIREDEYGTSVISIQFSKYDYILSIKNRYNHTVDNPDATFGNNLENIIPGLTKSFEEYYGHEIKQNNEDNFEIPNYVEVNGKLYKYNYEINNIYYCPDNIIIKNGTVITKYNEKQEQYIIMDYFILDLKEKTLKLLDRSINDCFADEHNNIETLEIKKEENNKIVRIITKNGNESIITLNNKNQIIKFENNNVEELEGLFLRSAKYLKEIKMSKLKILREKSFWRSDGLEKIELPNIEIMQSECFFMCTQIKEIKLPKLRKMHNECFKITRLLETIELPNLEKIEKECFYYADNIKTIVLPNLREMGAYCFNQSMQLEIIDMRNLLIMHSHCFQSNNCLKEVDLPELIIMKDGNFRLTKAEKINLPKLKKMEHGCFVRLADGSQNISMPQSSTLGENCFVAGRLF